MTGQGHEGHLESKGGISASELASCLCPLCEHTPAVPALARRLVRSHPGLLAERLAVVAWPSRRGDLCESGLALQCDNRDSGGGLVSFFVLLDA